MTGMSQQLMRIHKLSHDFEGEQNNGYENDESWIKIDDMLLSAGNNED